MPADRRAGYARGLVAEGIAAWVLRLKGYRVLATRYRTPLGEIDIVARRGKVLAFVEVKARPTVEAGLEAIGDNLLMETAASGPANVGAPGGVGFGMLMQGYTEASNVDAVTEITALIVAQRAYEMNSKVISAADEMLQAANAVKG